MYYSNKTISHGVDSEGEGWTNNKRVNNNKWIIGVEVE